MRLLTISAIFFFLLFQNLSAQVSLRWVPGNYYYLSLDQLWYVNIQNAGGAIPSACIKATIKDKATSPLVELWSEPFRVEGGLTNITPLSVTTRTSQFYDNSIREVVSATGHLPNGEYVVCIELINNSNQSSLALTCFEKNSVNFSAPHLRRPKDEAVVDANNVLLVWTPPSPIVPDAGIEYRLRLVEILPDQSPVDALNTNPVWFEQADLTSTSLLYPSTSPPLVISKEYAWQVYAFLGKQKLGETEVWKFKIADLPKDEESTGSFAVPVKELGGEVYPVKRYLRFTFYNEDATNAFKCDFLDEGGNIITPESINLVKSLGDNRYVVDVKKQKVFRQGHYYYLQIKTRKNEIYQLRFQYLKD